MSSDLSINGYISSNSGVINLPLSPIRDLSFGQNSCSVSTISSIRKGPLEAKILEITSKESRESTLTDFILYALAISQKSGKLMPLSGWAPKTFPKKFS